MARVSSADRDLGYYAATLESGRQAELLGHFDRMRLRVGDQIRVKVSEVDERGGFRLTPEN